MEWLLKPLAWLFAWRPAWRNAFGTFILRVGNQFYIVLAILFICAGAWNEFGQSFTAGLSASSFDWLMRNRPFAYPRDPELVVLDIDEGSLAKLAAEQGRWPWPREVLAQVGGKLEAAGARAIVFDILFADPDIDNPKSEAAFDQFVQSSRKSFFPVLRLDPRNDAVSDLRISSLNFVEREPSARGDRQPSGENIALIVPYFKSIYDTTRLGTYNIQPDRDNVVRSFSNYELLAGYRMPSLPYRLAREMGWPTSNRSRGLINWPRAPASYATVSFAEAYSAARNDDDHFFLRFRGKVVLIGSTAATLNDVKATPVDNLLPSIYVLATAIDNVKHNAFLSTLPPWWIWPMELILIAGSALLFIRHDQAVTLSEYFVLVPVVLFALALLSVSTSYLLLDLGVPAAFALSYFAFASLFSRISRTYARGEESFAFTGKEIFGRHVEVAVLSRTTSRDSVRRLLARFPAIKLWETPPKGLGISWQSEGWVLWRWTTDENLNVADSISDACQNNNGVNLQWIRVGGPSPSAASNRGLARAVADAVTLANAESYMSLSGKEGNS
jgi:adenylate cyclase